MSKNIVRSEPSVPISLARFINEFCREDLSPSQIEFVIQMFLHLAASHSRGSNAFWSDFNIYLAQFSFVKTKSWIVFWNDVVSARQSSNALQLQRLCAVPE